MPQMAKDEPQKPQGEALSRDELLSIVQTLVANQSLTADKVREIATAATIDAYDRTSGKNWDEKLFPKKSDFNPRGDKDFPRDRIIGEVFWLGFKLSEAELTPGEIERINALEPGIYGPDGTWVVKDMQPGTTDRSKRKLLVMFPNKDEDARARLPQGDRYAGKTGVEQMCEEMLGLRRVMTAGA
jgi:hypothetical protein